MAKFDMNINNIMLAKQALQDLPDEAFQPLMNDDVTDAIVTQLFIPINTRNSHLNANDTKTLFGISSLDDINELKNLSRRDLAISAIAFYKARYDITPDKNKGALRIATRCFGMGDNAEQYINDVCSKAGISRIPQGGIGGEGNPVPEGEKKPEPKPKKTDAQKKAEKRRQVTNAIPETVQKIQSVPATSAPIRTDVTNETNETEVYEQDFEPIHIIEPVSVETILQIPKPDFLIDNMIVRNSQTIFFADPKTGKSLSTLYMCVCLATGLPFLDRETHLERNIVYMNFDMDRPSFLARVKPIIKGLNPNATDKEIALRIEQVNDRVKIIDNISLRECGAKRPNFYKYENLRDIEFFIVHNNCELCVVDALSKVRAGSKENDNDDMSICLDNIRQCTEGVNCGSFTIHHAGKSGGMRGASAINAEVDLIMGLKRSQGKHDKLTLCSDDARLVAPFSYDVYPIFENDKETDELLSYSLSLTPSDTDTEHIVKYLMANGNHYTSQRDIAGKSGGNYSVNWNLVFTMFNQGILERQRGKTRGFVYRVKDGQTDMNL